jgi:hypothetical protein
MARPKNTKNRKRLSLETSEEVRTRMERLRDCTGAETITQVICRALAVYELLIGEQRKGGAIVVRQKDGHEKEVLLVPEG